MFKSFWEASRSLIDLCIFAVLFAAICALSPWIGDSAARADDAVEATLSIKDHKFDPSEIKVPAGKAIKLTVNNQDATAEEFESATLRVEKVIAGKGTATVRIKPLDKGSYPFIGEYHEETAKGVVTVE